MRQNIGSGTPWEPVVGYSRAVRVGNQVQVSGTTATAADGSVVGVADAYAQTVQTLRNIETALHQAGARMEHVVRTRMYLTDADHADAVASVHGEVFGDVRPASEVVTLLVQGTRA